MGRLIIDARWLHTGLGAYTGQLVRGLHELADFPFALISSPEHRDRLAAVSPEVVLSSAGLYSVREQIEVLRAARDYEVLHVPHYNVPMLRRGTLLVTIHDLNHLLDPTFRKTMKSRFYGRPMLQWAASHADHIFTPSEYSKQNLIRYLSADPRKITVAPEGVSPHIHPEPRDDSRIRTNKAFGFDGPYLLFVGNLKPHKNVSGLLKAFAVLRQRRRVDHKLLIVGDDARWRPALIREAQSLGLPGSVIFAGTVSDEQIRFAYAGADLTVLPSFEEGFGLPVIESMACGTPVACSNVASLPEVAGDAAQCFSPSAPESIASACETVLLNNERWRDLQQRGFAQAARFSWRQCAERHIAVYRRFLGAS